ncbi:MAG: N-6 DNA methylase [Candidatus Pacebacteria bacterium]|nr:N-6 DNA methylase [Candidatus Paceibacterota bacterium]
MDQIISKFTQEIEKEFKTGQTTEHTYRPAFKNLIQSLDNKITAVNEPKRQKVGAPDFIFLKNKIPIGYAEMKDMGIGLDLFFQTGANNKQFERYMALDNIFITNNLDFIFYRKSKEYARVSIGILQNNKIIFDENQFNTLQHYLENFLREESQLIVSAKDLAKRMAEKAKLVKDVSEDILLNHNDEKSDIKDLFQAFKETLMHDISPEIFADLYAQTLAYGLFVARCSSKTRENFSRFEAQNLIPSSNPFLRRLFQHISGSDLDPKISWVVDELATVFLYSDMETILAKFGTSTKQEDPVVHFYETFLGEYDKKLKKSRGVYYTPLPVVQFIVRAIDDILKKEFNLVQGLADTTKIPHLVRNQGKEVKTEIHKVQILDPAVGTGTFLNEVIKYIYKFFKDKGIWPSYVKKDLIPRLHGFELLMAPYTMCHFKLALTLKETGYIEEKERFSVWLTNSLEEGVKESPNLLMGSFLSSEAQNAGRIKNETPIMVVLGNPPYSGHSSNQKLFEKELEVYKFEPNTKQKLQERNSKWINDDYVKFIRFAEILIEKNNEGIVGMITPHGYFDNPTFRGMRWHLLNTFEKIHIFDLHGNANKKEKSTDGSTDENVFDIKQGVAIVIAIKKKQKGIKKLATISRSDVFGTRSFKYDFLNENLIESIKCEKFIPIAPNYDFVLRDNKVENLYKKGFSVAELFIKSSVGIVTSRDDFVIAPTRQELENRMRKFFSYSDASLAKNDFNLVENKSWKVSNALKQKFNTDAIIPISYRAFDTRFVYYDDSFVERSRKEIMKNFTHKNLGLVVNKHIRIDKICHYFIVNNITDLHIIETMNASANILPLYLFSENGQRTSNLKKEIVLEIEKITGKIEPENILDYIYAVLYSPNYREKYKEFLKIDFPKVPYPENKDVFGKLAEKGKELREIHLLESSSLNNSIISYPKDDGKNIIEKIKFEEIGNGVGRVMISSSQYFENVPKIAWEFFMGGYQPAQKWLKDRKGRELSYDDIIHYQKIIAALSETDRIMKEIDKII